MKELTYDCATFNIAERDDYSLALTRNGEEIHLYGIAVMESFGAWCRSPKIIHVLAPDPDSAISQARCALEIDRNLTPDFQKLVKMHAERLPLVIRGWGTTRF